MRFSRQNRREELTARLMGHMVPKLAGGRKMAAFHQSPYGDDFVVKLMKDQVKCGGRC